MCYLERKKKGEAKIFLNNFIKKVLKKTEKKSFESIGKKTTKMLGSLRKQRHDREGQDGHRHAKKRRGSAVGARSCVQLVAARRFQLPVLHGWVPH